nr:peptide deformylase 1B, chloroplastic [Ipomoea batatas]
MAMAGATMLHSSSQYLLPSLARRYSLLFDSCFHFRRLMSTGRLFHSISRNKPSPLAVRAQARRSLSSNKVKDELASREFCGLPNQSGVSKIVRTDGIGLSAPQVGINVQLMVFNPVGERGEGEEIVLVNPRVTRYSRKVLPYNEGCLSFPGIYADVERPDSVKVDAQDINGARFTVGLTRLPARVFQHEYDHLQGILFFDRMSDEVLDTVREDLEALEKKYEDSTGLPSPERINTRKRRQAGAGFGKS